MDVITGSLPYANNNIGVVRMAIDGYTTCTRYCNCAVDTNLYYVMIKGVIGDA